MQTSWQFYAKWLMSIEGYDQQDAITKAAHCWSKQTGRQFYIECADELNEFEYQLETEEY
jgi:hypothetical protein